MSTFLDNLRDTACMTDGYEREPFGEWLHAELDRRGWEPTDLASRMGSSRMTVWRWLNGERQPDTESCHRIAEALRLAPEYVLYMAGRLERLPIPRSDYDRSREIDDLRRAMDASIRRIEEVDASDDHLYSIEVIGRVPADSVRWTHVAEEGRVVRIPREWTDGARTPLFAVEVSGDCLLPLGIADRDDVICERPESPQDAPNGEIVVVRIRDEVTMKLWHRRGDTITLSDGHGNVVSTFSIAEDYEVIGIYLAKVGRRRRPGGA